MKFPKSNSEVDKNKNSNAYNTTYTYRSYDPERPQKRKPKNIALLLVASAALIGYMAFTILTTDPIDSPAGNAAAADIAFYVRAGDSADISIPCGLYTLYYATGTEWFGKTLKFGDETHYYKADSALSFYQDSQYTYGHQVKLYEVANGNLSTDEIEEADFP